MHGYRVCMKAPGAAVVFLRRTYADLSKGNSAISRSKELFGGIGRYTGDNHTWTFPNGSTLEFGHLQHADSHIHYQGAQYECLLWDELTQFEQHQYLYLVSRVRSRTGLKPTIRAGTNPGGIGHGWVRKMFVRAAPPETPFVITDPDTDEEIGTGKFVPAKLEDNPALLDKDPGYKKRLQRLPKALQRALRDGDWDVFEGQVFVEWREELHTLPPRALSPTWPRRVGLDYGTNRPFVALWAAWGGRLPDDLPARETCTSRHIYVYREVYERGWRDEQMAHVVAQYSQGEAIAKYLADPSSFWIKNNQTGLSPAGIFAENGVRLEPANNARIMGKRAVETVLGRCSCGVPRLRVMANCLKLIDALPSLTYDPHDVEDVDTRGQLDDPYDALRYLLMGGSGETTQVRTAALEGAYG